MDPLPVRYEYKIVCTGSRSWTDKQKIEDVLIKHIANHFRVHVIQGASPGGGADALVKEVADSYPTDIYGVYSVSCPVNEELDGTHKGKYLNRNIRMLETFEPDIVLAFRAAGKSNGTDHTINQARARGIPVEVFHQ